MTLRHNIDRLRCTSSEAEETDQDDEMLRNGLQKESSSKPQLIFTAH